MILRAFSLVLVLLLPVQLLAQDNVAPSGKVWVQIAMEERLDPAIAEAERYAREFEFTRIFLADSGWYAVALGVVDADSAAEVIAGLVRRGRVPRDAIAADGSGYLTEVWSAKRAAIEGSGLDPALTAALEAERRFSAADRRAVQEALLWSGDYVDAIDGRFGPLTRAAIRAFQTRKRGKVTGFFAPFEIEALFAERDSRQGRAGWRIVEDGPRGIRTGLATALFDQPTVVDLGLRLEGRGEAQGALLSLISLSGGARTFNDLYASAIRDLDDDPKIDRAAESFSIVGRSGRRVLHTHVERRGDAVRGFIISYERDIAEVMAPVAIAMRASFSHRAVAGRPELADEMGTPRRPDERDPRPRVDPAPRESTRSGSGMAGDRTDRTRPREFTEREPAPRPRETPRPREFTEREPAPRVDPRRDAPRPRTEEEPRRDRPGIRRDDRDVDSTGTGFYVTLDGKIVTNHHVVDGCRRMIVDGRDDVEVLATDRTNDLALLQHRVTRSPDEVARFAAAAPRLNSDVTVVGYPLYGLLGGLNVTRGVISSLAGLRGNEIFIQISAEVQPGNSGGPALDARGYVVGVVQSKLDAVRLSERTGDIPQNVNFAIRAGVALAFLRKEGVEAETGEDRAALEPADLAEAAQKFTVLLECVK